MAYIHSFSPIVSDRSRIVVLGSIPGLTSLKTQQYYAHKRNAFWQIVAHIFNFDHTLDYDERYKKLASTPLAVWDTLKACTRVSSLDSDIVESSIITNNFSDFFTAFPKIQFILFNGVKSEQSFLKYVQPQLGESHKAIPKVRLPSTSPANAALSYERKLEAWKMIIETI